MKQKEKKETWVVLILDFEKAYDKVDSRFLWTVSVKLNNQLGLSFVSHEGVR